MMVLGVTGCSAAGNEHGDQVGQPASNCAAIDSAAAAPTSPMPAAPANPATAPALIIGFDDYTAVHLCDYPGPSHYGWSSLRFKTGDGVHCELYDGPNSFQYYSSIKCWGPLPGVPAGVTLVTVEPGAVASYGQADLTNLETQMEDGFKTSPVDPASYRELMPGQKIIVPGSHPGSGIDINDEVCAVAHGDALTCEIQHPQFGDKKTHGFHLSTPGSRVY